MDIKKTSFKQFLETENPLSKIKLKQHIGKIDWRAEADQEMDPAQDKNAEAQTSASAPYMVGWSGQSHEWYGDDDMRTGRYKQKGDGGSIVAINVPDYATAQKIADDLDQKFQMREFPDGSVYGEWGKDHYMVDYHGAYVKPMSQADEMDEYTIKNGLHYKRIKDYGVREALKGLDYPEARHPANIVMKKDSETGEKKPSHYKKYSPAISDKGSHERWAVEKDVVRRNEKVGGGETTAKDLKARAKSGQMPTLKSYLAARPPRE